MTIFHLGQALAGAQSPQTGNDHNCADRPQLVRDRLSRRGVEEPLRGFRAHRNVESCPVIAAVQQMAVTGYVAVGGLVAGFQVGQGQRKNRQQKWVLPRPQGFVH